MNLFKLLSAPAISRTNDARLATDNARRMALSMVSGSVNTTAHTIRPAFEFVKTKPGFTVVSSVFLMDNARE